MQSIEIDFEVYKELTIRRETEQTSYNDVIRNLLNLSKDAPKTPLHTLARSWVCDGIGFPDQTNFRVTYKGKTYTAVIENGKLMVEGKAATSFSHAATMITNNNVNGWRFWECLFPGETTWRSLEYVRNSRKK